MSNGTKVPTTINFASPKKPAGGLGLSRFSSSPSEGTKPKLAPRRPKAMSFNSVQPQTHDKKKETPPKERGGHGIEAKAVLDLMKGKMGNLVFGDKVWTLNRTDIEDRGKIGSGVTGEVFRYVHKPTQQVMAVKKMTWLDESEERKRVLMDLNVMSIHKSPYIVKYYGSAIWNNEVWVFMELMTTCLQRLFTRLASPIPEDIVCKMSVSIVKALHYLKTQHKVIHRDVKPSNMLLDRDGSVKLCDFGISGRLVDSQAFTRNAGCAAFMAPERINLQAGNGGYDIRADIWSLGISLVQLATGKTPYCENKFKTEFELLTHIVQAPPPLPREGDFSPQFYDFLSKCLAKEVLTRPHYDDLLGHPLIVEYEEKPVDIGEWLQGIERTVGL